MSTQIYSLEEGAGVGAFAGLIAGAVMLLAMVAENVATSSPLFSSQSLIGSIVSKDNVIATYTGIGLQFVTSAIIGMIFGLVTSVERLRTRSIGNGIGLGIITGMIAMTVLFIPMLFTIIPKQMLSMEQIANPSLTEQDITTSLRASLPMIINSSIVVHIIFGAVLGSVSTAVFRRISVYRCSQCKTLVKDEKRFQEHIVQYHHLSH